MEELIKRVHELAEEELERCKKEHGTGFHSNHEAYAVLLEEFEEMKDEVETLEEEMRILWENVKEEHGDDGHSRVIGLTVNNCMEIAERMCSEAIQVLAMVKKFPNRLD